MDAQALIMTFGGAGTKPWELWTPDERVMLAVQLQVLHNVSEAS